MYISLSLARPAVGRSINTLRGSVEFVSASSERTFQRQTRKPLLEVLSPSSDISDVTIIVLPHLQRQAEYELILTTYGEEVFDVRRWNLPLEQVILVQEKDLARRLVDRKKKERQVG